MGWSSRAQRWFVQIDYLQYICTCYSERLEARAMFIPLITYPGSYVEDTDQQRAHLAMSLINSLVGAIDSSAIALEFFKRQQQQQLANLLAHTPSKEKMELRFAKMREREGWVREQATALGVNADVPLPSALQDQLEDQYDRSRWHIGKMPYTYERDAVFVHARSFLMSLDRIAKICRVLKDNPQWTAAAQPVVTAFNSAVPNLKSLRDSTAHYEDRVQGKAQRRHITPNAFEGGFITAPAGALFINESLNGVSFGSTGAGGEYGTVDVNEETLTAAQRCVQDIINTFRWRGPPMRHPRWHMTDI